jgi:hypothetical protein
MLTLPVEPAGGTTPLVQVHWPLHPTTAATTHYPAVTAAIVGIIAESAPSPGTAQGGRTMSNDLKAFLLSVGGLVAVTGSGLLVLWAVLS